MVRRIFVGTLLALSSILLVFSLVAIAALWFYNKPVREETATRLVEIDQELAQAEATLQYSQKELERALRIVDATEKALEKLAQPSGGAENIFEHIQSTLDDDLIPDLKTTRERIDTARVTLQNLQSTLDRITNLIPFIDLSAPDRIVEDLIRSAAALDADIAKMEVIAGQASTFVGDASYLLGGDLSETRDSLQNFLTATQEYEKR